MLLGVQSHAFLAEQLVAVEAVALVVGVRMLSTDERVEGPRLVLQQTLLVRLGWLLVGGYELLGHNAVLPCAGRRILVGGRVESRAHTRQCPGVRSRNKRA